MSFNTIVDPVNKKKYSIFSQKGKNLLKSYVLFLNNNVGSDMAPAVPAVPTVPAENIQISINPEESSTLLNEQEKELIRHRIDHHNAFKNI